METFLTLAFLFFLGSTVGWLLELLYRHLVHHKWINPGFLMGPYLPLYGFGLIVLFYICQISLPIPNGILNVLVTIFILTVTMTALEYVTGVIFIHKFKIKLWDYSKNRGNIGGIICPLFIFFWAIISILYLLLLHPVVVQLVAWFWANTAWAVFPLGMFYGLVAVDVVYSAKLVAGIYQWAKQKGIIIRYEHLKETIAYRKKQLAERFHYFSPFKSQKGLADELENYQTQPDEYPYVKRLKKLQQQNALDHKKPANTVTTLGEDMGAKNETETMPPSDEKK